MLFELSKNIEPDSDTLSLQNFRLKNPSNHRRPVSGEWIKYGEKVEIQGVEIVGGYFYLFDGRIDAEDEGIAASTIENALPIVRPPDIHQNYYPWSYALSYRSLSKRDRWTYLNWLAGDRDLDAIDDCFVSIYVFGIERRLLIDTKLESVESSEIENLRRELVRIHEDFPDPGLYRLEDLLTYTWLLFGSNKPTEYEFETTDFSRPFFRFDLARKVQKGEAIGVDMAWDWFQHFVEFHPSRLKNIVPQFECLFRKRYVENFGKGMILDPNDTKLRVGFEPLNSTLNFYRGATFELPDISQEKKPLTKLRNLAKSCRSELEPYQRFLKSSRKNRKGALKAYSLLPIDLADPNTHRKAKKIHDWIQTQPRTQMGTTSVIEISLTTFLHVLGPAEFEVLGKRNLIYLSKILERMGFSFAPNPILHISKPKLKGRIVLFESRSFEHSTAFEFLVLLTRFAMSISVHADTRTSFLVEYINQRQESDSEKHSLIAFLLWLEKEEVSFAGLKGALANLEPAKRKELCDVLIQIALLEDGIDKSKMKELEKIYRLLCVAKTNLITDIHRAMAPASRRKNTTELDTSLVRERETETERVKSILGVIFAEEEEEVGAAIFQSDAVGLDEKHLAFFNALTKNEEWTKDGLSRISKELNLMMNGALEVINDWAFEMTDNPLIEHDGNYFILQDTLEELTFLLTESLGGKHG